ncbi:MAG: hypothetical protein A2902_05930 [Elusimicrobia bacterium RIFCSPLOWO2_01_FULL_64_13]|nr:MAG: hypothetical protein A2902_05930 [Elusimicrobia bacterium RIFCSPLOWO2_01_FULL_64_13]
MPQRNGQNPIKSGMDFGRGAGHPNDPANNRSRPKNNAGLCPACKTEVPPKPGFRFSRLKCPKCGTSMSAKP